MMTDSVCKWVNFQYTIDCFAYISRKRARLLRTEIDLDQMSETSERNTEGYKHNKIHFLLPVCGLFASYDSMSL